MVDSLFDYSDAMPTRRPQQQEEPLLRGGRSSSSGCGGGGGGGGGAAWGAVTVGRTGDVRDGQVQREEGRRELQSTSGSIFIESLIFFALMMAFSVLVWVVCRYRYASEANEQIAV